MSAGIRERLEARAWAADWPDLPPDLPQDLPPVLEPVGWWEVWPSVREEALALRQVGPQVSLLRAHAFLERLENWAQRAASVLTWPPTALSFGSAIRASLDARDPDVLAVAALYPRACAHALALLPEDRLALPASQALVAQFRHWSQPPSVSEDRRPPSPPRRPVDRDRGSEPPELQHWMGETLAHIHRNSHSAGLREWMDERIKHLHYTERSHQRAQWFLEQFLPALAALEESQMAALLEAWPSHQRLTIPDPVSLLDQKRFWAIVRDAPARSLLMSKALPQLIDSQDWTFEQRYAFLDPMFRMVSKSADLFEERLHLWRGLGGVLDERAVVPNKPVDSDELFAHPPSVQSVSARAWFLDQQHPAWNDVLERYPAPRPRARP